MIRTHGTPQPSPHPLLQALSMRISELLTIEATTSRSRADRIGGLLAFHALNGSQRPSSRYEEYGRMVNENPKQLRIEFSRFRSFLDADRELPPEDWCDEDKELAKSCGVPLTRVARAARELLDDQAMAGIQSAIRNFISREFLFNTRYK